MVYGWDIAIKGSVDRGRVRQLAADLEALRADVLDFEPLSVDSRYLKRNKIRIFPFPRSEEGNEYFIKKGRKRYICLNASVLKKRYWAALQFLIHGLAHSFCHLRDEIGEEAFCEWVGYSVVEEHAKKKGENFARKIIKSIMKLSSPAYKSLYRAAKKLEEKEPYYLVKLNNKAKNRKIKKSVEKRIISRALKTKKHRNLDELDSHIPELEKGFRKIKN